MAIWFHEELPDFKFQQKRILKYWIAEVIKREKKHPGTINFIAVDDDSLLKINIKYLKNKYLTDVVTFNYNVGNLINGDIYLSVERIRENAKKFDVMFHVELKRVMVHGTLHLLGYNDFTSEEKRTMREKEDYFLKIIQYG